MCILHLIYLTYKLYNEIFRIKKKKNVNIILHIYVFIGKMGRSIRSYLCYYQVFKLYIDDRTKHFITYY